MIRATPLAVIVCVSSFGWVDLARAAEWACVPGPDGIGWECRGAEGEVRKVPDSEVPRDAPTVDEATQPAAEEMPPPAVDAAPAAIDVAPPAVEAAPPAVEATPSATEATPPATETPDAVPPVAPLALVDPAESDWTPRTELSPSMLAAMPQYCGGMYIEPPYPQPLDVDPSSQSVRASGSNVSYWIDERAEMSGNVTILQGNRSLLTPQATLDIANQHVVIDQGVLLREPGFAVRAGSADADLETGESRLNDAAFVLHPNHLRGEAQVVAKDGAGNITLTHGYFTRCEPGNNGWRVSSESVQIDKGAVFGVAHDATIRVKGVPILYTPYIKFPVSDERVSGFLMAEIGYSDQYGADLSLPYYFNLAPNYDATLTTRYIAERGAGLEAEARHMSSWAESALGAAFLYDDNLYNGTFERDEFDELGIAGEFETENRWLLSLDHDGAIDKVRTFVDYAAVSDVDYFADLGTDLSVTSRVDLERVGSVTWEDDGLLARVWAQRFQNLDLERPDPYQRLPELYLRDEEMLGPFSVSLATAWAEFDRNAEDFTGLDRIVGRRAHVEPRFSLPLSAPWGFLALTTAFQYTLYDLDRVPDGVDDTPEREIWMGSADAGIYLDREFSAFGHALQQTLEPRVYYLYQDFFDQSTLPNFDASPLTFSFDQLYRENRFSGVDRIGDANQTSLGLTTRFLDAATGQEYFHASIGEIYYLNDRKVTATGPPTEADAESRSAIAGEVVGTFYSVLRLRGTAVWDTADEEYDELGIAIEFARDRRHIFNVGYRRLEGSPPVDQSDVAVYWPVSAHWSFIGRWNYDFDQGRPAEVFGGIEYGDCCWQLRVLAMEVAKNPGEIITREFKRDRGVFLQIVFRGLAGVGNKVDSVMESGIKGYYPDIGR